MTVLRDSTKAGFFVDPSGSGELALGPQHKLLVVRLPREANAFVDEPSAEAHASRHWLDEQQAQLGHSGGFFDEKHRADDFTLFFSDPAAFSPRIEFAQKVGADPRHQRLELFVVSVLVCIQHTMAVNHPADV